jgi:hypothetical protein
VLVVDPEFSRLVQGPLCSCGLPAAHLNPESGQPRPHRVQLDETVRILNVGVRPVPDELDDVRAAFREITRGRPPVPVAGELIVPGTDA